MKAIRDLRRAGILLQKRFSLLKYNAKLKLQRGQSYDISSDIDMMNSQIRSLNLLDFSINREKDLFLLDIYSDQS
jgi:hypothetical protein